MQSGDHGRTGPLRYLEWPTQALAVTLAFAFFCSGIASHYASRWTETRADFWRIYAVCLSHSPLQSALLKSNNHSIFFPSLFWLADIQFFHNNQELLFYIGMFFQLLTAALMLVPIWREASLSLTGKLTATLVVIVGNFWMGRASITASGGFNCMCTLALGGAVLAFLRLPGMQTPSQHYWSTFIAVVAGAYLASFSFGSGLAVWPTLLFLAWTARLSWRSLVLLGLAGLSAAVIYLALPGSANPNLTFVDGGLITKLGKGIYRLCMLVGTPVLYVRSAWSSTPLTATAAQSSTLSLVSGAIGLLSAAWTIGPRLVRRDLSRSRLETMSAGMVIFNLGALVLIIIGRVVHFRVNPSEVAATRYIFWSAIFWTGLFLTIIQRADSRRWLRWPVILFVLVLPIAVFPEHRRQTRSGYFVSSMARAASTSLINGVDDPQLVRFLSGIPSRVYDLTPKFRARRLDMFAGGLQDWIGRSASSFDRGRFRHTGLNGMLTVQLLVRGDDGKPAARFQGWALQGKTDPPQELVVINPAGVVCGVARPTADRAIFNRKSKKNRYIGSVVVGYIRDYEAGLLYVARSTTGNQLSEEKIVVQKAK